MVKAYIVSKLRKTDGCYITAVGIGWELAIPILLCNKRKMAISTSATRIT